MPLYLLGKAVNKQQIYKMLKKHGYSDKAAKAIIKWYGWLGKLICKQCRLTVLNDSINLTPAPSSRGKIRSIFARFERRIAENRLQIVGDFW